MTNELLVNRFLNDERRSGKKVLTLSAYSTDLKQFLSFLSASPLPSVPLQRVRTICQKWTEGLKSNAAARKLTTLKSFLSWAHRKGYVKNDLSANIIWPKRKTVFPARPLTASQIARLRRTAEVRERLLLELLLQTGMKLSDIIALKMKHLPSKKIFWSATAGRNISRTAAADKDIPDYLRQALEYYLAAVTRGPRSYVLVSAKTGRPYSARMAGMILSKLGKRAGVRGVTPRNLRATFKAVGRGGLEPPKPSRYKLDALTN